MSADTAKYQAYRNLIETLVFLGGVWSGNENTAVLYKLIAITGFCVSSTLTAKILIYCLSSIGNVSEFAGAFQNTLSAGTTLTKIVTYAVHRAELLMLDKKLGGKFEEELKNEKNQPALLKKISLYSKFLYILVTTTAIAVILFWVSRYISIFKYKKYRQLLQGNYPFPVKPGSPIYWTIVAYESCMCWYSFYLTCGVDNHFGMHCFRICGLLHLATERFKDFNVESPNCKKQLRECVAIHQLVIRSKVALQNIYGVIIIWNYVTSAGIMCTLLWQADQLKSRLTVSKLMFFIGYIGMKLVQSFIYAYYGSRITLESENYQEAIYNSSWPGSGNVRLLKDLLLILTQRAVTLKACGFFFMTMQFFEKIVNTTISYFLLL